MSIKINPSELQQIIKEEALRLKHKMMLESEKASILKRLQEIEAGETEEESVVIQEGATEQEAQQFLNIMLKNKNTVGQIQKNVNAAMELAKQGKAPAWAQQVFAGKNLADKNQFNQAFQDVFKLWADGYKKYYMQNPKMPYNWDVNTNAFTPIKSGGTGLGFGMGTQFESEDKTKKK